MLRSVNSLWTLCEGSWVCVWADTLCHASSCSPFWRIWLLWDGFHMPDVRSCFIISGLESVCMVKQQILAHLKISHFNKSSKSFMMSARWENDVGFQCRKCFTLFIQLWIKDKAKTSFPLWKAFLCYCFVFLLMHTDTTAASILVPIAAATLAVASSSSFSSVVLGAACKVLSSSVTIKRMLIGYWILRAAEKALVWSLVRWMYEISSIHLK